MYLCVYYTISYANIHILLLPIQFAMAGNAVRVSRLCKSPRCALFVLGEHIQQAAMRYIRMVGLDTEVLSAYGVYKLAAKYNSNTMAYKEQLVRRRGTSSSSKSAIISRKNTTAKTAPIKTTVPLLDPDRHTKMPRRLATLPATSPSSSASPYRFIVIQGTFYVQRRRYADLFACVHKLIVQGHTNLRLVLLGKTVSGRKLHIPSNIQNHTIIQSDKAYTEFYSTLLASDILVSFANEGFSYMVNRSTSSVTMGVICEVPLALPLKMLNKYPCIRDQHWHKNITAHDDCSTLTAAVKLSDQQLLVMRQEVKHCKEVWLDEGRRVLEEFVQRPVVSSGGNSTERYVRQCWDLVMKSTVS
ncbi:hypothetical protein EON63_02485 [archaeon]|nr:MAG: hypothetical protein EON63_02485 [archaeon]